MGILLNQNSYIHAPGKDNTQVMIELINRTPIPMRENQLYTVNPIEFKRLAEPNPDERWRQKVYF